MHWAVLAIIRWYKLAPLRNLNSLIWGVETLFFYNVILKLPHAVGFHATPLPRIFDYKWLGEKEDDKKQDEQYSQDYEW